MPEELVDIICRLRFALRTNMRSCQSPRLQEREVACPGLSCDGVYILSPGRSLVTCGPLAFYLYV